MNRLVKITRDEDGVKVNSPKWHLYTCFGGSPRTVCTGEAFGPGESSAEYETREHERGITCPRCREIVKFFKSVKL